MRYKVSMTDVSYQVRDDFQKNRIAVFPLNDLGRARANDMATILNEADRRLKKHAEIINKALNQGYEALARANERIAEIETMME